MTWPRKFGDFYKVTHDGTKLKNLKLTFWYIAMNYFL